MLTARFLPDRQIKRLSPWSQSTAKRIFDCVCVLLTIPLLMPIFLVVVAAVRLTSSGPVFFLQRRMGRQGRTFTILKFRTMVHDTGKVRHAVTTADNQRFTPIGLFLRRWKLDELPQLLNVLAGHMSLVGPRPKMPEHVKFKLRARPGITGAATIAFAREEAVLARVPKLHLDNCYHSVVLPAKRKLDREYMARATFLSDLKLIVNTVLRRWDSSVMEDLLNSGPFATKANMQRSEAAEAAATEKAFAHMPIPPNLGHSVSAEQISAS
ncbi:MAG: sugar transferase [Terracidiphilus sp.]|nr:sugar transferase [Terracidiphilus sp.]